MRNRNDAMTPVSGHLDHGSFASDPTRRLTIPSEGRSVEDRPSSVLHSARVAAPAFETMRSACRTFPRIAAHYRDAGEPDAGEPDAGAS